MKQYEKIELNEVQFENSKEKNKLIAKSDAQYLVFANTQFLSAQELIEMVEEYGYLDNYGGLVLCMDGPGEKTDLLEFLSHPQMEIFGFVISKADLSKSGRFNEQLDGKTNWEFLCRLSEHTKLICLECSDVEIRPAEKFEITWAYQLVRHMNMLKEHNLLEPILERYLFLAKTAGREKELEQALQYLLDHPQDMDAMLKNTAPVFIIKGIGDVCYGILQYMADELARALSGLGEAVMVYGGADMQELSPLLSQPLKMIVGFQAMILLGKRLTHVNTKKVQFMFDDPIPYMHRLNDVDSQTYYLCQDENYVRFLNRNYMGRKAIHLPPGGSKTDNWQSDNRPYDIIFMGTYIDLEAELTRLDSMEPEQKRLAAIYLSRSIDRPNLSSEEQLIQIYQEQKAKYADITYEQVADAIAPVIKFPSYGYRKAVVDTILHAGYELHVFGDSWKKYRQPKELEGEEFKLVIHEEVAPQEVKEYMRQAKISLNVMSWHKGGMTERIADAMLAGAVCLTDETSFLCDQFEQFEDIVMYSLDRLEELPGMIERLLLDDQCRKKIVQKAYEHASREFTWDAVADFLVRFAEDDTIVPQYELARAQKFYVLAPAGCETGGVELAHQMCAELNRNRPGCAKMAYYSLRDLKEMFGGFPMDVPAPAVYDKYHTNHAISLAQMDHPENVIIFPEANTFLKMLFKSARTVVWWMSVDGYLSGFEDENETNIESLGEQIDLHLYQSYYAKDFLDYHIPQAKKMFVGDYINEVYDLPEEEIVGRERKNRILYNPKKGMEVICELQKMITDVEWTPIEHMSRDQIMELMLSSKIYVDFGPHPGRDRIPREAASMGCVVITNRRGSAAYEEDVPIMDAYKFEDPLEAAAAFAGLVRRVFDDFDAHQEKFRTYRDRIRMERQQFCDDVKAFMADWTK